MTETPSYDDDFEPLCNWIHKKDCDTLVLHLPKFKNEQLKIDVNPNTKVLKISGERALKASKRGSFCNEVKVYPSKRSRFSKEVRISEECNVYDIRAKFVKELLKVKMPKKPPAQPVQTDRIQMEKLAQTINSLNLQLVINNVAYHLKMRHLRGTLLETEFQPVPSSGSS